jgi:ankyrin repeat protein
MDRVVSRSGTNPLIEAVSYDNYEAAELILSEGAVDVNAKRTGGKKTPLEIARRNNNEAMQKLLIRYGAK